MICRWWQQKKFNAWQKKSNNIQIPPGVSYPRLSPSSKPKLWLFSIVNSTSGLTESSPCNWWSMRLQSVINIFPIIVADKQICYYSEVLCCLQLSHSVCYLYVPTEKRKSILCFNSQYTSGWAVLRAYKFRPSGWPTSNKTNIFGKKKHDLKGFKNFGKESLQVGNNLTFSRSSGTDWWGGGLRIQSWSRKIVELMFLLRSSSVYKKNR